MTEPRTVREYCTQKLNPIANTNTASVLMASRRLPNTDLATPLTSSAIRMAGKVNCTSGRSLIQPSKAPPAKPALPPTVITTPAEETHPITPTPHHDLQHQTT